MFVSGGSQVGDAGDQATLGLKVTNFGPIVEADIELRPLTVFVGPSNTGKSYLAILIYALHIVFATDGDLFQRMFLHGLDRPRTGRASLPELSDEDLHQLFNWLERIPEVAESDTVTSLHVAIQYPMALRVWSGPNSSTRTPFPILFVINSRVVSE